MRKQTVSTLLITSLLLTAGPAYGQEDDKKQDNGTEQDKGILVVMDIPLIPERILADDDFEPVVQNIEYKYAFWPSVRFFSENVNAGFETNLASFRGEQLRETFQISGNVERTIWLALIGAGGFYSEDVSPFILAGENYHIDHERESHGLDAWVGAQIGDFNKSFLALRIGKGLVKNRGDESYVSSVLGETLTVPLFYQTFGLDRKSVEGRLALGYIASAFKLESDQYKLTKSSGQFGLKHNIFSHTVAAVKLELIPSLKHDTVSFLIQRTKYFGSYNRLMFGGEQPEWQVYLRFAFK